MLNAIPLYMNVDAVALFLVATVTVTMDAFCYIVCRQQNKIKRHTERVSCPAVMKEESV